MLTVTKSGRTLPREARLIVYNVAKYLKDKKKQYNLRYNVAESASEATGVSAYLVRSILSEVAHGKLKANPLGKMCSLKVNPPGEKCRETKDFEDGDSDISPLPIIEEKKDEKEIMNIVFCDVKVEPLDIIDETITCELPLNQDIEINYEIETPPADISDVMQHDEDIINGPVICGLPLDEDIQIKCKNETPANIPDVINDQLQEIKLEYESSSCEHVLVNNVENNPCLSINNSGSECQDEETSGTDEHKIIYHSKGRPFSCNKCDASFVRELDLKRHAITHTTKRYFCEVCSKPFRNRHRYIEHVLVHKGEGPFSCDKCPRQFARKGYLKQHMLIHGGKRPFVCNMCKKYFTFKCHLDLHMSIHSRERSFNCDMCKTTFINKRAKNCHMKKTHGVFQE